MIDPRALYDSDDVAWLSKPDLEVEAPWVERKRAFDRGEIARQISAVANGQPPGGLIVVGVSPDGKTFGLGDRKTKVYEEISRLPVDGHDWKHRFVPVGPDDEILFIWVPFSATRVVCRSDGVAFVRRGSSTLELKPGELAELRYQRGERSFEDEPVARYDAALVHEGVAADLITGIVEKNGLSLPLTTEDALANKRLTGHRGDEVHITVAGVLAVGRRPSDFIPGARVLLQRFDGREERFGTERNVTKERWFDGPTKQMLKDIQDFVGTLIREFDYLGPDGTFVTQPEYPKTAWEEAIVNAVVHRSYSIKNAAVTVRMFDDRMEVESPGGYPGPNRPDAKGVFRISYPRNPHLAEALRYLEVVRLAREGTRRMSEEMARMGLPPPHYDELDGAAVRVTLWNDIGRRRPGAPKIDPWAEIGSLLREDLAFYRRRAYDKWRALQGSATAAPAQVLQEADRILRGTDVEVGEKVAILSLLEREPEGGVADLTKGWARALEAPVAPWAAHDRLSYAAATTLARSDDALEIVLELLLAGRVPVPAARGFAIETLHRRLDREPPPPRPWIDRVLEVCLRYPAETASLYHTITGRNLSS